MALTLTTLVLVVGFSPSLLGQSHWIRDPDLNMPGPRNLIQAAKDKQGRIYIPGGNSIGVELSEQTVFRFDESTGVWEQVATLSIPRSNAGAAADTEGRIYVIGGMGRDLNLLRSVERYDSLNDQWEALEDLPQSREGGKAVADLSGENIYFLGGNGEAGPSASVYRYAVAEGIWVEEPSMIFRRFHHGAALGPDGRIYAIGGFGSQNGRQDPTGSTAECFDPGFGQWTQIASTPIHNHQVGAVASDNRGFIYVMGGYNCRRPDDCDHTDAVERYDPATNVWEIFAALNSGNNNMAAICGNSGRLYIFGGDGRPSVEYTSSSSSYAPSPDSSSGIQPIDRLGRWDNEQGKWVSVMPGEVSSGNVHVIVHGWAPLELGCVSDQEEATMSLPVAWRCTDYFRDLEAVAIAISNWYMDNASATAYVILAYSWIDDSATVKPSVSRARANNSAEDLAHALKQVGINSSTSLHILGHSHGARVGTKATISLENDGINVRHLTLWDSPERMDCLLPEFLFAKVFNNLDDLLGSGSFTMGVTPSDTFIDNYYSTFGRNYNIDHTSERPGLVNINLAKDPCSFVVGHRYPVKWYARATATDGSDLGISWSPLFGDRVLFPEYEQAENPDLSLVPIDPLPAEVPTYVEQPFVRFPILIDGSVIEVSDSIQLNESSSAFWIASFERVPSDTALSFEYEFVLPGDGDEFGIWINDDPYLLIAGETIPQKRTVEIIDVSNLATGKHTLTLALHSFGESNASVRVTKIQLLSRVGFERANANGDEAVDISDAIFTLLYLFAEGGVAKCLDAIDANDDGEVNVTDAIHTLQFIFLEGISPREPFGACGHDPSPDQLNCENFDGCRM